MNDIQRKANAAGFLHALKHSEAVRDRWVPYARDRDWAAVCALIAEALGLAQTPTQKDLAAMRDHVSSDLLPECEELEDADDRIEAQYIFNGAHPPL